MLKSRAAQKDNYCEIYFIEIFFLIFSLSLSLWFFICLCLFLGHNSPLLSGPDSQPVCARCAVYGIQRTYCRTSPCACCAFFFACWFVAILAAIAVTLNSNDPGGHRATQHNSSWEKRCRYVQHDVAVQAGGGELMWPSWLIARLRSANLYDSRTEKSSTLLRASHRANRARLALKLSESASNDEIRSKLWENDSYLSQYKSVSGCFYWSRKCSFLDYREISSVVKRFSQFKYILLSSSTLLASNDMYLNLSSSSCKPAEERSRLNEEIICRFME